MNSMPHSNHLRQRGAATLVIVMMLFLVIAMLAAYANRSILFEQRISSSYYRSSVSQEMADGAIDWTVAMLNGIATNAQCQPVATGGTRFVDRYLSIDVVTRDIKVATPTRPTPVVADCRRDDSGLTCRCLELGSRTAPAQIPASSLSSSFGIIINPATSRSGTLSVTGLGCTSSVVDECGEASQSSTKYLGFSMQQALLAMVSAVRSPPTAPLTVKGILTTTDGGLGLHNTDPRSAGMLLVTGQDPVNLPTNRMESVPGTPPSQAIVSSDQKLRDPFYDFPKLFKTFMGATPAAYKKHPSLRELTCAGNCSDQVEAAYNAGKRILWVEGDLTLSSDKTIGSDTDPLVIIATGRVELNGPMQLTGMLVSQGDMVWQNGAAASRVVGAMLVGGAMTTTGTVDIVYRQSIADQLRNRVGSFVRVPGGWIDQTY